MDSVTNVTGGGREIEWRFQFSHDFAVMDRGNEMADKIELDKEVSI